MSYDILHTSTGILRYSGNNRLAMEVDQGLSDFYRSLIPRYMPNNRPRWAAHVTVVRDGKEEPVHREFWGKYEGEEVSFLYSPYIHADNVYYWLNVFCVRLEEIRIELGLPCTNLQSDLPPLFRKCFHMTLGNRKQLS